MEMDKKRLAELFEAAGRDTDPTVSGAYAELGAALVAPLLYQLGLAPKPEWMTEEEDK